MIAPARHLFRGTGINLAAKRQQNKADGVSHGWKWICASPEGAKEEANQITSGPSPESQISIPTKSHSPHKPSHPPAPLTALSSALHLPSNQWRLPTFSWANSPIASQLAPVVWRCVQTDSSAPTGFSRTASRNPEG